MNLNSQKISDPKLLFILICICIMFFVFILPMLDNKNISEKFELQEQFDNLNIGKIDKNICSRQCCKFTQWPIPFNTQDPGSSNKDLGNYIGSNFTCNYGQTGGGCVCYQKSDNDYLANRGQDNMFTNNDIGVTGVSDLYKLNASQENKLNKSQENKLNASQENKLNKSQPVYY